MVELAGALRSKRCACLRKPHFLFLSREWRYASDIWARKGQKRRNGGGDAGGAGGAAGADGVPLARQSQRMRAKREADDSVAPLALPAPPALPAASLVAHPPSRLSPVGMQVQARGVLATFSLACAQITRTVSFRRQHLTPPSRARVHAIVLCSRRRRGCWLRRSCGRCRWRARS
jgi:hypothetical protein